MSSNQKSRNFDEEKAKRRPLEVRYSLFILLVHIDFDALRCVWMIINSNIGSE